MDKQINDLLIAIAETCRESIIHEMKLQGLEDSRIIKNIRYKITDNTIQFSMNYYYRFIESGRKPFAKKVPVAPLLAWMKRKNIPTGNGVVWAIRESIYKNGIKARPFFSKAMDTAKTEVETLLALDFSSLINKEIRDIFVANNYR